MRQRRNWHEHFPQALIGLIAIISGFWFTMWGFASYAYDKKLSDQMMFERELLEEDIAFKWELHQLERDE